MRRRSLAAPFVIGLGALVACNALSGVGDLEVDDTDASVGPTSSGAGSSSSASSTSGMTSSSSSSGGSSSSSGSTSSTSSASSTSSSSSSSSSSTGGVTPVTLIEEHFDASCEGWATVNAITDHDDSVGHDKPGACIVCSGVSGDFFITKTVAAPRAGKTVAQAYIRRLPGLDTPTSANVVMNAGSGDSSYSTNIGASFTLVKNSVLNGLSTASGASVTIKIGKQGASAGDCIVIDDIVATLN